MSYTNLLYFALFLALSDTAVKEDAPSPSELGKLSDQIAKSAMLNDPLPAGVDETMRKELAFRTQSLLEHLFATKVINASTLDKLCWDIVEGLTREECSEVELAYTLLILGNKYVHLFLRVCTWCLCS